MEEEHGNKSIAIVPMFLFHLHPYLNHENRHLYSTHGIFLNKLKQHYGTLYSTGNVRPLEQLDWREGF